MFFVITNDGRLVRVMNYLHHRGINVNRACDVLTSVHMQLVRAANLEDKHTICSLQEQLSQQSF